MADKTPTPADLKVEGGPDPEAIARMNQPIDTKADYKISGQAIVALYAAIDEVPMKYARQMLPLLAMNIERIVEED